MKMATKEEQEENVRKWIAALRSGKYDQGLGGLRSDGDKFCCLGVLIEVLGMEWTEEEMLNAYSCDGRTDYLGDHAMELVGLASQDGLFFDRAIGRERTLASMNDDGNTFEVIADMIDRRPYGLFKDDEGEDA